MDKQLATTNGTELSVFWKENLSVASEMVKTGLLPSNIKTPQQAVLIMLKGKELGVPPMESLGNIFIVDNKPSLASQLMLSLLYRSGVMEDIQILDKNNSCTVTMKRKGMSPYTATFSEDDARKANLLYKNNWKNYPKNMCRARAISMCARVVASDVIGGLYTPEEIEESMSTERISTTVEKSAELAEGTANEYTAWLDETMLKIRYELTQMTEPEQVNRFKKSLDGELKSMIEADRALAESEIKNRYYELITGLELKPKIKEYKEKAELCATVTDLESWFKAMQAQAMDDLTDEELRELVDYCTALRFKMQQEAPETPVKEIAEAFGGVMVSEQPPELIVCQNVKCSIVINDDKVAEYSKKHFFGKVFCRTCQNLARQKH